MQLLLIRHALPLRSEPGQGSDPDLSDDGIEQAKRLPDALARFPVSRLVSSPQRRAMQTAQPVADALGLTVDIDDRLAEYDRDLPHYMPIEEIAAENPRICSGWSTASCPAASTRPRSRARIKAAVDDLVAAADHDDTVAVFSHGGVINALLHQIMGTARLLSSTSTTRRSPGCSRRAPGSWRLPAVNGTEHVWDLLPRNQRW